MPVYALQNVDILYPKKIMQTLIGMSEKDLQNIWNKNASELYEILNKFLNEDNEINRGKIKKQIKDKIKNHQIKCFKKVGNEMNGNKKISDRVYFYRDVYQNWAISKLILENKKMLWSATEEKRKDKDYVLKSGANNSLTKSYGYLLSTNEINNYLNLKQHEIIDDTKPYIYWNWQWSYNKYIGHASRKIGEENLIKIDLTSAFDNMTGDIYENKLMELLNFINKIDSPQETNQYNLQKETPPEGFQFENKKRYEGIKYGFILESYLLANINFIDYKEELFKAIIQHFESVGYEDMTVISYVDDTYISFKNNDVTLERWEKFQEKWNKDQENKGKKESKFIINESKTIFYEKGDVSSLVKDSTWSAGQTIGGEGLYKGADLNSIDGIDEIINSRELNKNRINHLKKEFENTYFITKDSGEKYTNLEKRERVMEILSNKYSHTFFNAYAKKNDYMSFKNIFDSFMQMIQELFRGEFKNKLLLKFADTLIRVRSSSSLVSSFIETNIQIIINSIGAAKLGEHMFDTTKIIKHEYELSGYKINTSLEESIVRLIYICWFISEKNRRKSSEYGEEDFNLNNYLIAKQEEMNNFKDDHMKILDLFNNFIKGSKEEEEQTLDEIDKSFLSLYSRQLIDFISCKEGTLLSERINLAKRMSHSRITFAKNIVRIGRHILLYEFSDGARFKPTLFAKVNASDLEVFSNMIRTTRYSNTSSITGGLGSAREEEAHFAKVDMLMLIREYVKLLWKNGSRELEHFSNHGVEHSDSILDKCIPLMSAINNIDPFAVIISIYMHDIGLLDDESFFNKNNFYKFFAQKIENDIDLIKVYTDFKDSMSATSRENHGDTSAFFINQLYNSFNVRGSDISKKQKNISAKASAIHNGSHATYISVGQLENKEYFLISLFDLLDINWERIERPLASIGTSTASPTTKKFWIKDLLVNHSNVIFNTSNIEKNIETMKKTKKINLEYDWEIEMHQEMFCKIIEIAQRTIEDLLENGQNDMPLSKKENEKIIIIKENLKEIILFNLFETEIQYGDSRFQGVEFGKEYNIFEKMGIESHVIKFKWRSEIRAFDYKTIKLKNGAPNNQMWLKEVYGNKNFIKSLYGVFEKVFFKELLK
ncbi:hypothetical protein C4B24_04565, partial [Mycoplasma marinum]